MPIEDLWYKHAVIYCLEVDKFLDANGDGVGDFAGLSRKLDYLAGIGVTCLWLQPFYPSPNRDNGYDVADYYGVDARYGTLGDYVEFMNHAQSLGLRVIVDLVVNHTSIEHRWFQAARRDRKSPYRDWYVWADERPADHAKGIVFPGTQETTWTWDEVAGQYYFHRFYEWQADLNTHHPAVREEISKIMGFWLQLGASGFRMDAVPFLIEHKGANVKHELDFELLHDMRDVLQWRRRDAILLAEANVPPAESVNYFGEKGDRLQAMLNFPVNQRLWYAMATSDIGPLREALEETRINSGCGQWVQFLRSHDELDLGRLTDEQRQKVFAAFGPEKTMQLYDRGIRRRLAPMLGNDRQRIELALSLLFSLPGTPLMLYGDEVGLGENLTLEEREASRTPMPWSAERNGGFSRADAAKLVAPVVDDGEFSYLRNNVAAQQRDSRSLLNRTERLIRARQECCEIGWGDYRLLELDAPAVLGLHYHWKGTSLVTLHNFSDQPQTAHLQLEGPGAEQLADVFRDERFQPHDGLFVIEMPAYGYRWLRVGGVDPTLDREDY